MSEWIDAEQKPKNDHPVLAAFSPSYGGPRVVRVVWIPKFLRMENGDYDGDADYNEKEDEYYWPEGWYEWSESAEINYKLSGEVTHWMELPKLPGEQQ